MTDTELEEKVRGVIHDHCPEENDHDTPPELCGKCESLITDILAVCRGL